MSVVLHPGESVGSRLKEPVQCTDCGQDVRLLVNGEPYDEAIHGVFTRIAAGTEGSDPGGHEFLVHEEVSQVTWIRKIEAVCDPSKLSFWHGGQQ